MGPACSKGTHRQQTERKDQGLRNLESGLMSVFISVLMFINK